MGTFPLTEGSLSPGLLGLGSVSFVFWGSGCRKSCGPRSTFEAAVYVDAVRAKTVPTVEIDAISCWRSGEGTNIRNAHCSDIMKPLISLHGCEGVFNRQLCASHLLVIFLPPICCGSSRALKG